MTQLEYPNAWNTLSFFKLFKWYDELFWLKIHYFLLKIYETKSKLKKHHSLSLICILMLVFHKNYTLNNQSLERKFDYLSYILPPMTWKLKWKFEKNIDLNKYRMALRFNIVYEPLAGTNMKACNIWDSKSKSPL